MSSEHGRLRALATPAVVGALMLFPASAVVAQTTYIGQPPGSSVSVDMSVLDELGRAPTVPELLQPSVRSLLMPNAPQQRSAVPQLMAPSEQGVRLQPPTQRKAPARTAKTAKRPAAAAPARPATSAPKAIARPASPAAAPPAAPSIPAAPPPPPAIAEQPAPSMPSAPAAPSLPSAPPAPPAPPAAAMTPPPPPAPAASAAPPPPPAPPEPPAASTAPPAPPPPAPAAAPRPSSMQTASLPPAGGAVTVGQQVRLPFAAGSAALDPDAEKHLDAVAKGMAANEEIRLQLLAYAGGAESASQARRLSLSRALAVRSHLIKQGVRSTSIDVRALGDKFEGGPPDRVDVIVTSR